VLSAVDVELRTATSLTGAVHGVRDRRLSRLALPTEEAGRARAGFPRLKLSALLYEWKPREAGFRVVEELLG